jgi:hypothetical protein
MAVDLLAAIHERWAATPSLCALLPAARVVTGMSADPAAPRAVIGKQSDRPLVVANDGSAVDAVGLRIEVFHAHHDAAAAIVAEIKAAFDRADFAVDGGRVIAMRRENDAEHQEDDGLWRMMIEFICHVYQNP